MPEQIYNPDQMGHNVWPPENGEMGQSQMPPQGGQMGTGLPSGPLGFVRSAVENQIYQAIDHYANQVPGGSQFSPEAKQAVAGILDNLQNRLENEAQSRLGNVGGMLGGNEGYQGNQGNQGGQL